MNNKMNRKQFFKLLTLIGTATGLTALTYQKSLLRAISKALDSSNYLPILQKGPATPTPSPTASNTPGPSPTATATFTPGPSSTATDTNTPGPSPTATDTSTIGPSPTPTDTPTSTATMPPGNHPKVVHVHNPNATNWDFSSGWYGDHVDQGVVNTMMDEGLITLTGKPNIGEAWSALLPEYLPGKGIAIKVNLNNSRGCNETDNEIDALMQPVNALIQGMDGIGVQYADIWVFDAIRPSPTRFTSKCLYPGVHFIDDNTCAELATFNSNDPNAEVIFQDPNLSPRRVADVIINASYLIDMPIIKDHPGTGVTLGFKNHFGTIEEIMRGGLDNLHLYTDPSDSHYSPNYNPLVDIYSNTHIRDKTILSVGDGLFGCLSTNTGAPTPWESFGGQAANSIFLSIDPVAMDCIMLDVLDADPAYHPQRPGPGHPYGPDDYLKLAEAAGIGVYERGDPWNPGYQKINYIKLELR